MKQRRQKKAYDPRHGFGLEPGQHQAALNKVNDLEAAMVETMVTRAFVPLDVVQWMFPAPVIKTMHDAYGLLYYSYSEGDYDVEDVGRVAINFHPLKMEAPAGRALAPTCGPNTDAVQQAIQDIRLIHIQFNCLRGVLEWLDKNATAGAIKYYFPSVGALIPSGYSAFHRADGIRYKEPQGITTIVPEMRSAAALIASALLLPKPADTDKPIVTVQLGEPYDRSQKFRLA